jgi:hypothetical protein
MTITHNYRTPITISKPLDYDKRAYLFMIDFGNLFIDNTTITSCISSIEFDKDGCYIDYVQNENHEVENAITYTEFTIHYLNINGDIVESWSITKTGDTIFLPPSASHYKNHILLRRLFVPCKMEKL